MPSQWVAKGARSRASGSSSLRFMMGLHMAGACVLQTPGHCFASAFPDRMDPHCTRRASSPGPCRSCGGNREGSNGDSERHRLVEIMRRAGGVRLTGLTPHRVLTPGDSLVAHQSPANRSGRRVVVGRFDPLPNTKMTGGSAGGQTRHTTCEMPVALDITVSFTLK